MAIFDPTALGGIKWELSPKEYLAATMASLEEGLVFWNTQEIEGMTGMKTVQQAVLGDMSEGEHVPGATLAGQDVPKETRTISLEDRERHAVAEFTVPEAQQINYNYESHIAHKAGYAIATTFELHTLRNLWLGANKAAGAATPGGQLVTRTGGVVLATQYPVSLTGSQRLQADLENLWQLFREDHCPDDDSWFVGICPYLMRVLRQDQTLVSRDYTGPEIGTRVGRTLKKVAGFWLIDSTNITTARANWNTGPLINNAQGYIADMSNMVALAWHYGAVKAKVAEQIMPLREWVGEKRKWLLGATAIKGQAPWIYEYCGAVRLAA